jgi:hydrophobe/amphiphile efflux-1 (HAE1) family protein
VKFTDIFIKRPVLSIVLSLLIALSGLIAFRALVLQEFPSVNLSNITIQANFSGTTPQAMQELVTGYIQDAVASVDGVDYIESSSSTGSSTVTVHLLPDVDVNEIINEITTQVQQAKSNLPDDPSFQEPIVSKVNADSGGGLMFIAFHSSKMTTEQISDYLGRVVAVQLQTVPGVAGASSQGGRTYAMRIWLDPAKMAARHIAPEDVKNALLNNNVISTAGYIETQTTLMNIEANTGISSPKAFNKLIITTDSNGTPISIGDIGYAELGSTNYSTAVMVDGEPAVVLKISTKADANPLTVAKKIKALLPKIEATLPPSLHASIVYDESDFIQESVNSVMESILEAILIVLAVIFLCLGTLRLTFIPLITIPLSLTGVCAVMLAFGFSLNVLTLLALVLAIGLVVDDAIVVSENITRHLEHGLSPMQSALTGAREISLPIITMTLTLIAVFLPIGLAGGLTGVLFSEFSYTLAGAVLISGFLSLTLSPMLCSRLLTREQLSNAFVMKITYFFDRLKTHYQAMLHVVLSYRAIVAAMALFILMSCVVFWNLGKPELAPTEDQGVIFINAETQSYATFPSTNATMNEAENIISTIPGIEHSYFLINRNNGQIMLRLLPKNERSASAADLTKTLENTLALVPGIIPHFVDLPTLPSGDFGFGLSFVLYTTNPDLLQLLTTANTLTNAAKQSGLFKDLDVSLKIDRPEFEMTVNETKAAQLGITNQDVINALDDVLGGGKINYFRMAGRNYQVIAQAQNMDRVDPDTLSKIHLPVTLNNADDGNASGTVVMVPLSSIASLKRVVKPTNLSQFQRLNSTYIAANMNDNVSLSEGIAFFQQTADKIMPLGMSYDLSGQARQLQQEGNRMLITFAFALVIIFLVLAAQFESFLAPLVVMVTVPLSLFGALLPIALGMSSLNLFAEIGLLTLIGLISKHGILLVQFANELRKTENFTPTEAVTRAASIRLRPILMTTLAMMVAVIPLLFSIHGLANSQRSIALVIFFGMLIGTFFTLFIVPTIYTLVYEK